VWNWVPLAATWGLILLVVIAAASSEIWRISATRRSGRIQSLAVLPLRDLSQGARDEYFADGVTEMLTNNLGHLGSFRVIGRASAMSYRDGSKAPWQIARNLKVDAVIQGYVTLAGERVRVTAQLIETKSEAHIWSKTYERDLRDALTFEGEIAQDIAYELQAKVTPRQQFRLTNRKPAEPEVRDTYFKGRYYSSQLSCASFQTALENFQRAAIAAPNFALAYAGLASSYSRLAEFGCLPEDEVIPKARAAATRAISLDHDLAEAHTVLGTISFLYDWDWATAHSELRRATELNPSDALTRAWYGAFLFSIGKSSEAFAELHKAKSIDPASGTATLIYAFTLYNSRRYDEAIEQFQKVISNYPDSTPAYFGMAVCYERKRMRSKALKNYLKAKELSGADPETVVTLRKASSNGGLQGFWRKELEFTRTHPDTCWQTISAAHVGDKQQTLALLEQAYDERCSILAWLKADPLYDRVRSEAQFQALMRRMALPGTASPDRLRKRANSRRAAPNSRLIVPARSG
jgi:TolB-like protein/Flp pilus assembly protein TadD